MDNKSIIDFEEAIRAGFSRYQSRSAAIALKSLFRMKDIFEKKGPVEVRIPNHIFLVHYEFFMEFFEDTLRWYASSEDFHKNVSFTGLNSTVRSIIEKSIGYLFDSKDRSMHGTGCEIN